MYVIITLIIHIYDFYCGCPLSPKTATMTTIIGSGLPVLVLALSVLKYRTVFWY